MITDFFILAGLAVIYIGTPVVISVVAVRMGFALHAWTRRDDR